MRLLVIYRHYWPDNPHFARVLKVVLERMAADGHSVTVFAAQPSYKVVDPNPQPRRETIGGVRIIRMPLPRERRTSWASRFLNAGLFTAGATLYGLLGRRPDLIFINTAPAFAMGIPARVLRAIRGVPYVYNVQDIHPEGAVMAGRIPSRPLQRLLQRVDLGTCRRASAVMALSDDMAGTLRSRGYDGANIRVINNFIIPDDDGPPATDDRPLPFERRPGGFLVLYAGNHGAFQGLHHVVSAAQRLASREDIQFLFMGEGDRKADLIAQAGDLVGRSVFFIGHQPWADAQRMIRSADLSLVPLQPGMVSVSYPSKLVTNLAMGARVLVTADPTSDIGELINAHDLGATLPPDNPDALADAILTERAGRGHDETEARRIAEVARDQFGQDALIDRWTDAITSAPARR